MVQMQGPCLFPFKAEKQTAMQSVLEDLLSQSSHLFSLSLTDVMPKASLMLRTCDTGFVSTTFASYALCANVRANFCSRACACV